MKNVSGGGGWIRTSEAVKPQGQNLLSWATRPRPYKTKQNKLHPFYLPYAAIMAEVVGFEPTMTESKSVALSL